MLFDPQANTNQGGAAAAKRAQPAGLVHSETSQSGNSDGSSARSTRRPEGPQNLPGAIEIDQHALRLRRLSKNVKTAARLMEQQLQGQRHKGAMVTLTYRPDAEWDAKQITGYIQRVRDWFKRRGHKARYVWVLELTKKGRPHYHVLWWMPKGVTMPKADKRGWWPYGMTKSEWARRPVGYLAKYASKGDQDKSPPKGARLYGVGGLGAAERCERAWWNLPTCVRVWGPPEALWRRSPGGGWICKSTGEWRESLYDVILSGGRVFALPRRRTLTVSQQATRTPAPLVPSLIAFRWCRLAVC